MTARWTDGGFLRSVLEWADNELRRIGYARTGDPQQFHVRPWSTVLRLPTSAGNVYLKAVPPYLVHEIALTAWLARQLPGHVLPVLASDVRRGLMLLPDGGRRLRETGTDPRGWQRMVAQYAEVQLAVAPDVAQLLRLGVPDRRLALLPAALAAVLPGEVALIERYTALCAELADAGIPETIQMDDLHDGNVFVDGERLMVFDWGDASISHPFVCLGMILSTFAAREGLALDHGPVERLRDAYLEPFSRFGAPEALRRAAQLAQRVAPTVRILAWKLAMVETAPDENGAWGESLDELIEQQRTALA